MRKLTVLLSDDSSVSLNTAHALHASSPCVASINYAYSGPEALAQLGHLKPNLVLMDTMMPGMMSGFEMIRNLRAREAPPCVVAVTLYDGAEFRAAARRSDADGFISKRKFGVVVREFVSQLAELDHA